MGISVMQSGVTVTTDSGQSATVTPGQITQAAGAVGGASTGSKVGTVLSSTGSDAAAGATIGSVVPVVGTVVGGIVGGVVGLVAGAVSVFGPNRSASVPGQAGANMPSQPTASSVAAALATKWYTLYFTIYAPGGILANAATQASGIAYWTKEITNDGPAKAWANFSSSPQPVQYGVPALASALTPTYGPPTALASVTASAGSAGTTPSSAPALPAVAISSIAAQGGNSVAQQAPTAAAPVTAVAAAPSSITPELELVGAALAIKVL